GRASSHGLEAAARGVRLLGPSGAKPHHVARRHTKALVRETLTPDRIGRQSAHRQSRTVVARRAAPSGAVATLAPVGSDAARVDDVVMRIVVYTRVSLDGRRSDRPPGGRMSGVCCLA